jgi:murein DD-endopeptidase MepM/ murein hydrolase activator NlpD
MQYAQSGGKDPRGLLSGLTRAHHEARAATSRPRPVDDGEGGGSGGPSYPLQHLGDALTLPTTWKGTHVTSGLGWNTKTAEDIMAKAGTQVGAPEPGTVEYFHPTGAQGGGSMMFKADSGREYWLGHLAEGLPAGTRVPKRGQRIAYVSNKHAAPHVHIDVR